MFSEQWRPVALSVATVLWVLVPHGRCAEPKKEEQKTMSQTVTPQEGLSADRVREVSAMLTARPTGVGRPISDRAAWDKLAANAAYQQGVKRAEPLLKQPLPEQPNDLYLDFSRTGNRTRWQKVAGERRSRVTWLVLAECMENKGRFLAAIEQVVAALCAERTWVMPAHDRGLANFNGKSIDIDLASSALAWNLATADHLLGDKLSSATRRLIVENVRGRVLDPYREMFTGARKPNWWMLTTSNWNAVCLAGVTGAALTHLESRDDRSQFVVAAEKYSRNFLAGFTADGYCSEGLGYWDYGFGHYVLLSETVWQATSGKLDLFARPEVKTPATFGSRIQIIGGVSPAFADCGVTTRPAPEIMFYVNRRFGLGLADHDELAASATLGSLFEAMLCAFPNSASQMKPAPRASTVPELRSWFDHAGILIGRPAPGSKCRMGVALKGGHNAEHHNHNDVGSYVVVLGQQPVLLDPGAETYTGRTFSSQRYESKLLNSFGHPVPVVAGQLQRPGRDARGKVLEAKFSDSVDTLKLDIRSAYPCPELKMLERTFVYSREGSGSLTVTDKVEFASPQSFGTALITKGGWRQLGERSLVVHDLDEAVRVEIGATGGDFTIQAEEIHEDADVQPTRIGIVLTQPVTSASVTVSITPMHMPEASVGGNLLRNGGFEYGTWCWSLPQGCQGSISDERAAGGKWSLKITDHDAKVGSNVSSALIPVSGAGAFTLRGKAFHVSGRGVGLYIKLFNAQREMINPRDARGYIASIGGPSGEIGKWTPFALKFQTPPDTASIQLWIHSANAADVEAYLDDLEIVKDATANQPQ